MKEAAAREWKVGDVVGVVERQEPGLLSPAARWHLVQVMSGKEAAIGEHLRRYKCETYIPMLTVLRPVPRKRLSAKQRQSKARIMQPKLKPFMPGYLLVKFDMQAEWHALFRLAGVRGLWCKDGVPWQMPESELAKLRAREVDGAIPGEETVGAFCCYNVGDLVRLSQGPFAGFPATVDRLPSGYNPRDRLEELDESKRVTLLVNIFGRATPVDVHLGEFMPI